MSATFFATYGITAQGFNAPTLAAVLADIQADFQAIFGAQVPVNPESRNGQFIGIWAEREFSLWELGQALNAGFDPDQAVGTFLDALVALTGSQRQLPTSSQVTETLTGTPGTNVPQNSIVATVGSLLPFLTDAAGLIVAAAAWAQDFNYATLGVRITNVGNVYQVIQAGVSQNTPGAGPTGTGSNIVDGTVHWRFLGAGTGSVDVPALSSSTGPIEAPSGTLTQIQTPVAGWSGAINVLDAVLGTNLETDPALRLDREAELHAPANAAINAIYGTVKKVAGVTSVTVLENLGETTDANGTPPHGVQCVVVGGANQDIWNALVACVGAGIGDFAGNTVGTAVDSQGVTHTIGFTRPTAVPIYMTFNVTVDPGSFPSNNGATQVADLAVSFGDQFVPDQDVVSGKLAGAICFGFTTPLGFTPPVPGILDPGFPFLGLAPGPVSSAAIPISPLQIATFDTSRVVVNVTNGVL